MKKFLLATAIMLAAWSFAHAASDGQYLIVPRGGPQALATADYGGVYVATSAFSTAITTVCAPCSGVFYGAWFSSGAIQISPQDSVDIYDASSTVSIGGGLQPTIRIYNNNQLNLSTTVASGFNGPPKPIRFTKGLLWKPSNAVYNMIDLLYFKSAPLTP